MKFSPIHKYNCKNVNSNFPPLWSHPLTFPAHFLSTLNKWWPQNHTEISHSFDFISFSTFSKCWGLSVLNPETASLLSPHFTSGWASYCHGFKSTLTTAVYVSLLLSRHFHWCLTGSSNLPSVTPTRTLLFLRDKPVVQATRLGVILDSLAPYTAT